MDTFNQIIPKTLVLTAILVVFAIFYLDLDIEENTPIKQDVWQQSFERLKDFWTYEMAEKAQDILAYCPELKVDENTNKNYYLCHPELLKCYLDHHKLKISLNSENVELLGKVSKIAIIDKPLNLNALGGVHTYINLTYQGQSKKVFLENSCDETHIPFKSEKLFFIDKFQVRNNDVNRWINLKRPDLIKKIVTNNTFLSHPSMNLTFKEKEQFCFDHGKKLLNQAFWEQATFYPDYANNKLFKHPYPWTKKHIIDFEKEDYCSKIYSQDCHKKGIPFIQMNDESISWSGVKEVLGGYPEIFSNKEVLISSSELLWEDPYNQLGKYKKINQYKKGTAFRCMREI